MFRITPGLFLLGSGIFLPSSVTFIVRSFSWCRTLRFGTSQNDNALDRGCRDDDRSGGGISDRSPHLRNGLVGAAFALPDPQWNEDGFA